MAESTVTAWLQYTTGTLHRLRNCGVTRRTRLYNSRTTVAQSDIDNGRYRLCEKCNSGARA